MNKNFSCIVIPSLMGALVVFNSCESLSLDYDLEHSGDPFISNYFVRTFDERVKGMPQSYVLKEQGKLNAIKKAYQLTEFTFTPVDVIEKNDGYGSYTSNVEYKGVPYSSVKEIGTYVGNCVSFYTFSTAIRNPRSKLYLDRLDQSPYHGTNCRAYYGTTCSSFVSYALGLSGFGTYDFADSDLMEDIGYSFFEDLEVADVLWKESHVAIITDIEYEISGRIKRVEISEALHSGCVRRQYNRSQFSERMLSFEKAYRYNAIEENNEKKQFWEEIPSEGGNEIMSSFVPICVDKGDRSNYLLGEDVTINLFTLYDSLVVYKDDSKYQKIIAGERFGDITLSNLPYGCYSAQFWYNNTHFETSWIVVDYDLSFNLQTREVFLKSSNSLPILVGLCAITGSRGYSASKLFHHILSAEEQVLGMISVPLDRIIDDKHTYVQARFETKFGIISTKPIKSI